jgi:hypothetical protein
MVSIMDEIISYKMCAVKVRNAKLRNYLKVAPYSFRSVSRKFCPHARLIMLHATHVVDVARVAGFLKLCRDIYARAFVGLSAGRARKLKS